MGFSGGGSNITKPHTHDSNIVQDGGSLAANVTQFGLSAGSILYSDGANIQELAVGSASDTLTVNGAATAPEWAAAGGSVYQLVGTTTALVTAPNGYDGLHLSFDAIDMTAVTSLVAIVSATRTTNEMGFLWNGETSNYSYGGMNVKNDATDGPYGHTSASLLPVGSSGGTAQYGSFTINLQLNEGDNKIYCYGVGGGSGGAVFAGGGYSLVQTTCDSISFVEDASNLSAGRLTVYKVSR